MTPHQDGAPAAAATSPQPPAAAAAAAAAGPEVDMVPAQPLPADPSSPQVLPAVVSPLPFVLSPVLVSVGLWVWGMCQGGWGLGAASAAASICSVHDV